MSGERQLEISNVYQCVQKLHGFAGLEVRHAPKYRVVAKFTHYPRYQLRKCTYDRKIFKAVGAARSLKRLQHVNELVGEVLSTAGIQNETLIATDRNRVIIRVLEDDLKAARKAIRKKKFGWGRNRIGHAVRFEASKGLGEVESLTRRANSLSEGTKLVSDNSIPAGFLNPGVLTAGNCTTGFSVKFTDPDDGLVKKGATVANPAVGKSDMLALAVNKLINRLYGTYVHLEV